MSALSGRVMYGSFCLIFITKNLGSFDEYLTKCIEAAVLKIKQNEPYITLPESALIEGEAER